VTTAPPIATRRLSLVVLDATTLALMATDGSPRPFQWPEWWPDDEDRSHVALWRQRAAEPSWQLEWGPRAIVDAGQQMVGHAGFHRSPVTLAEALADETFAGRREPDSDAAVEIGYTIFPEHRGNGYATEAVTGLLHWASRRVDGITVLASVAEDNAASLRVLDRVGGFTAIGTCVDDDGTTERVFRRDVPG
jgi:ribosomal-protein-alanine N-acetyltransferase